MKLTTQGLIVILFPIAFEFILIATCAILVGSAHQEFERKLKSESIISECNVIVTRCFDGIASIMFSNIGHDDVAGLTVDEARSNFNTECTNLYNLIKTDPAQYQNAAELKNNAELVSKISRKHSGTTKPERIERSRVLLLGLSKIVVVESQKAESEESERIKQRERTHLVIAIVAITGIVLSIAIALLCAWRMVSAIKHITENTDRFSRRQPLLPMLPGSDEVTALDAVIHAMDFSIEEALQKARALIENAADLVCSIDRDGYFEKANRFSKRMLGIDSQKLVGTPVIDLVISEDCAVADEQINKAFDTILGSQFELRLRNLEQRIVETSWSAFWSRSDKSLFCVVSDITERKNIERLKADFIAMISHDLRSPLMSIGSSIALVQSGALGPVSDPVMKDLEGAERTVDRLVAMINDLLDFEKMEAGKMQFNLSPVSLDEVIEDAFRDIDSLAVTKAIHLQSEKCGLSVMGDREKIIQLLINLLGNAIRYSPDSMPVSIACLRQGKKIEVAVQDRGPGVPEEFHEKVFAPFENAPGAKQTKEGGTGLGLAICKLIMQGHNGDIGVRNRPGGGSEFWFLLDAAKN